MPKKNDISSGNGKLAEAMALLINNQAAFVGRLGENEERFARIEKDMQAILRVLAEHSRILAEHSRLLEHLPEAVRDKIGFRAPP